MRELMSEFKELRLHGMAGAWEELTANGGSRVEASRWLIEHLLQAEHTDRVMRSIGYQMHAARFPVHRDLAGFDFEQSKVDQKLIRQLADLSFADVLLWVGTESEKNRSEGSVICVAHCRPTTASTAFPEDAVGTVVSESEHPQVLRALVEGRVVRGEDETWREGMPPRKEAVPVRLDGRVIAVLSRDTNLSHQRAQSQRVGAGLDESGPVRRVLHAVGEHQGFLLPRVQSWCAEQP